MARKKKKTSRDVLDEKIKEIVEQTGGILPPVEQRNLQPISRIPFILSMMRKEGWCEAEIHLETVSCDPRMMAKWGPFNFYKNYEKAFSEPLTVPNRRKHPIRKFRRCTFDKFLKLAAERVELMKQHYDKRHKPEDQLNLIPGPLSRMAYLRKIIAKPQKWWKEHGKRGYADDTSAWWGDPVYVLEFQSGDALDQWIFDGACVRQQEFYFEGTNGFSNKKARDQNLEAPKRGRFMDPDCKVCVYTKNGIPFRTEVFNPRTRRTITQQFGGNQIRPQFTRQRRIKICQVCHKTPIDDKLMKCNACFRGYYCSRKCQRVDWKRGHIEPSGIVVGPHKNVCARIKASRCDIATDEVKCVAACGNQVLKSNYAQAEIGTDEIYSDRFQRIWIQVWGLDQSQEALLAWHEVGGTGPPPNVRIWGKPGLYNVMTGRANILFCALNGKNVPGMCPRDKKFMDEIICPAHKTFGHMQIQLQDLPRRVARFGGTVELLENGQYHIRLPMKPKDFFIAFEVPEKLTFGPHGTAAEVRVMIMSVQENSSAKVVSVIQVLCDDQESVSG